MLAELEQRIKRRERLLERVIELLNEALQLDYAVEELDPDTPLFGTGLGLDSVDAVEIVVALESEFEVTMNEEDGIYALRTVNTLVDVVLNRSET